MKLTYSALLAALAMLLATEDVHAQLLLSQTSTWREDVDAGDLSIPDEAGADLNSTLETSANYNQLDILNMADSQGWKITVSKQDINWPAAFLPFVQRTGNGFPCATCPGVNQFSSVSGYLQITNLEQDFIFGTGEVTDINLQFKIEGLSLTVDAQNYSTEVIFTIYGD